MYKNVSAKMFRDSVHAMFPSILRHKTDRRTFHSGEECGVETDQSRYPPDGRDEEDQDKHESRRQDNEAHLLFQHKKVFLSIDASPRAELPEVLSRLLLNLRQRNNRLVSYMFFFLEAYPVSRSRVVNRSGAGSLSAR